MNERFNLNKTTVHRIKNCERMKSLLKEKEEQRRQIITTVEQGADLGDYLGHRPFATAKKASVETNFSASITTTLSRI